MLVGGGGSVAQATCEGHHKRGKGGMFNLPDALFIGSSLEILMTTIGRICRLEAACGLNT